MAEQKMSCDNCGSAFTLLYDEDEVSYSPTHCSFCGDFFDAASEELDFNEEDSVDYFSDLMDEDSPLDDN